MPVKFGSGTRLPRDTDEASPRRASDEFRDALEKSTVSLDALAEQIATEGQRVRSELEGLQEELRTLEAQHNMVTSMANQGPPRPPRLNAVDSPEFFRGEDAPQCERDEPTARYTPRPKAPF